MYLLDTNIWLERLLDQERGQEVGEFLSRVLADNLFITDFSFHSIGVILNKLGQQEVFLRFVQDVFLDHDVHLIALGPEWMERVIDVMNQFALDFDDTYRFVAADVYGVILVSFDRDFMRTPRGRVTPKDILAGL